MKNIKGYHNLNKEIELVDINIKALNKKQEFLNKERDILILYKNDLEHLKVKIAKNLKDLVGVEYELYYEIVINGLNVTKAVDKVAFKYDMDVSSIWKNYYKKVKDMINKLNESYESLEKC